MDYQDVFKRYELKYLLDRKQKERILCEAADRLEADRFGQSLVCNIYFDTPDHILARRSLESPVYKEKLRLRSYGRARDDSRVFLELKKKYKGVVYKRRIGVGEHAAMDHLLKGTPLGQQGQIVDEIDYFRHLYPDLAPKVYLSYEREAFCGRQAQDLRITFDEHILWRQENLSLCSEAYGTEILEPGEVLMEIKIASAMPLWLSRLLSELGIFKTSFSKYGRAYGQMMQAEENGENRRRKYA